MTNRITLRSDTLTLTLAPDAGGSIARFDWIGAGAAQPLMRAAPDDTDAVLAMACFPLVPYANRIRGGSFECDGETVKLAPNMAGDISPLHGQGWLAPWQVADSGAQHARLSFAHERGEWPWAYEAWQEFSLEGAVLTVSLGCRNLSDEAMPCALGLHPYFPCANSTILDTGVSHTWFVDKDVLPIERIFATGRYNLANRAICGAELDNGFDGWNGSARIYWPDDMLSLTMASGDAEYFQVYSPRVGDFFAAEPVQQENCALNAPQEDWEAKGMALLAPDETRVLTTTFAATAL